MKKLLDFLSSGVWQSIGTILALAALVWGLWDKPTYDLQVVVLANTSLVKITESLAKDVKVTYAGHEATNISLVEVKLENTGNQSLPKASFERPIKFIFPTGTEIIKALPIESIPENLDLQITSLKNQAVISPTLLNPQDRATIRFVVINMLTDVQAIPFKVDARIVNVKSVSLNSVLEQTQSREPAPLFVRAFVPTSIVIIFLVVEYRQRHNRVTNKKNGITMS